MTTEQAQAALNSVIETLRPIVKKIEDSPAATKNHYGEYMAILSGAPLKNRKSLAACLIKAGANEDGIVDALKFI